MDLGTAVLNDFYRHLAVVGYVIFYDFLPLLSHYWNRFDRTFWPAGGIAELQSILQRVHFGGSLQGRCGNDYISASVYFFNPAAGWPQPCWKRKCNRPSESRAQATEEFETGWHDAGLKACLRLHSTVTFGRRSGFRISKVPALQNFWLNDLLHQGSGYVQRRFQNSDIATLERHF